MTNTALKTKAKTAETAAGAILAAFEVAHRRCNPDSIRVNGAGTFEDPLTVASRIALSIKALEFARESLRMTQWPTQDELLAIEN